MIYGGGKELQNEIYGQNGMFSLDCNMIGPETSGWFRNKVESLASLKGLKMRFFGLGAQVMQKLGVSTQLLAGADIYPALERGVIDATEFSMPNMDIDLGFYQIAKFNYYPGWHQQSSIGELLMNKAAWDALDDQNQAILEASCGRNIYVNYAETEAKNPEAMNKMKAEYGVTNVRWTDEELAAVREGLARGAGGAVGERSDLQEGCRQLPRVPRGLQDLGRRPGARSRPTRPSRAGAPASAPASPKCWPGARRVPAGRGRAARERCREPMMNWENFVKRYVWDDQRTPYLVRVSKITRRQADYEIYLYAVFLGLLFSVITMAGLSGALPEGRSEPVALYGFSVVCSTHPVRRDQARVAGAVLQRHAARGPVLPLHQWLPASPRRARPLRPGRLRADLAALLDAHRQSGQVLPLPARPAARDLAETGAGTGEPAGAFVYG